MTNILSFLIKISEESSLGYCDLKISPIKVLPRKLIRLYELARQRDRARESFQRKLRNVPEKIHAPLKK